MANQIIIDIGAAANDGTGDPLRTAFNYVNNNFSNVWNTGLPASNVAFSGNRILTVNTNGNLILAPNGVGKVVANVDIVPNINQAHSLGALDRRWNTVYTQYLDVTGDIDFAGDVTVGGNLTVTGNTIQIGNITTETKTIQLANAASTANAANGSGVTVGANDNIATMLYSSTSNTWVMNIGANITGNVTAPYFIGNGALLTGLTSNAIFNGQSRVEIPAANGAVFVDQANEGVVKFEYLDDAGNLYGGITSLQQGLVLYSDPNSFESSLKLNSDTANLPGANLSTRTGTIEISTNTLYGSKTWEFGALGDLTVPGNIVPVGNNTQSLGNATNQWSDLYVSNATIYMNNVPISLGAGNVLTVNGEAVLSNDSNTNITTTGTIDAEILTANTTVNIGTGAIGIGDDDYLVVETLVPGGLRPSNDDTYNLGNVSHRWAEVHANVYYGNGSQLTGLSFTSISNDGSIVDIVVPNGDVTITADSTQTWAFDTTGNLILPNNGSIIVDGGDGVIGPVSDDLVIAWDNEEIRLVSVQGSIEMQADNAFRVQTNYDGGTDTYLSRWEFNQDEIVNITGSSAIVTEAGDLTLSGGRNGIASGNVTIQAVNNGAGVRSFDFGNDGNLTLPLSGNLVGATPNNNGYLTWFGNSSGDNNGYTTMRLVPDDTVEGNDQYLILDPTSPGHIHIRAGGTQDNSSADLFLGGENSYFRVGTGPNPETSISANSYVWGFTTDGTFNLPGDNAATAFSRITSLGNSSGDGAGYTTLSLIPDINLTGSDQYLIVDPTAPGHIHIRAGGTQDNSSAELIVGGEYSHFKVGSGANATVYVNANAHIWWYNQDGTVQLPVSDYGYAQFYTSGGANLYLGSSSYPINIVGTDGTVLIPGNVTANGNVTGDVGFFNDVIVNNAGTNALLYTNSNREIYDTGFAYDAGNDVISGSGAISTTGNISAGYFIGDGSQLTGLPASYSNSNVATFLAAFGSNTISTTGNITAGNITGNINITGNVTGTSANVDLVAGSYTWSFNNTGVAAFPGTLSVTGNINSTGVTIGNGAVNNCAVAMTPTAGTAGNYAFRDYSTANSIMFFDTTIGSANIGGSFQFRGSNAYTTYANISQYGVSQPTLPAFRVYGNGVTNVSTTTNTTGQLNGNNWAVDYNQGSYLNSTTGTFTAPVAGLYQVNLVARVANNSGSASQAIVYKNYGTANTVQVMWETAANCTVNHFGVSTTSKLAAGDTLSLVVTIGQLTFDANDSWSVAFLG